MADKKTRKVLTPSTKRLKAGEEPERHVFVVRQGQTFGMQRLRQGQEIELTVEEALPFADKLEPADRGYVLPGAATPQELADAGYVQVPNPSPATTDRDVMTPEQRAETSQTNLKTGVGPEPTAGGDISEGGGRKPAKPAESKK